MKKKVTKTLKVPKGLYPENKVLVILDHDDYDVIFGALFLDAESPCLDPGLREEIRKATARAFVTQFDPTREESGLRQVTIIAKGLTVRSVLPMSEHLEKDLEHEFPNYLVRTEMITLYNDVKRLKEVFEESKKEGQTNVVGPIVGAAVEPTVGQLTVGATSEGTTSPPSTSDNYPA